jgi:hypothetical protein
LLPKIDYYLDESDPDVVILRRQDDSFVAAFSAQGATREGIAQATKEDYWKVIEANAQSLVLQRHFALPGLSSFGIRHLATRLDHLRNPLTPR